MGRILLDHQLPADMRGTFGDLDKKGVAALFDDLAARHPDLYKETAKKLSDLAKDVAYGSGGFSFGLSHMQEPPEARAIKDRLRLELRGIQARPDLDDVGKERELVAALQRQQKPLEDAVFDASVREQNPLARQVQNVGRGNKTSLKSLRAGDLLYEDPYGNPIPIAVMTPYSQGLKPVEYWAAGYGARKSTIDTKFSTMNSGFLSKQLNQLTHRLVVTREEEPDFDHESRIGLPVETLERDNEGALLARAIGPYKRNTILTPKIMAALHDQGHARILIRSPMVGGPVGGGVYANDVGVRERGGIAPPGDFVGLAASQALSEKLTQGQLSSKHGGGVAGAGAAVSGFKGINLLIQTPKTFPGGASHAQLDGRVTSVSPAPQGGHYIQVGDHTHYVPHGLDPLVKQNDHVEAGDVLSEGIPNPAEIVAHKGIGEGRRHFVKAFSTAYANSGMSSHRRNVELLARGLIDHVEVVDDMPGTDHVPGDVTAYQSLEAAWTPREGSRHVPVAQAVGKYLEKPVLHHTVGTKIRPSTLKDFKEFGVNNVLVHDDPPPFKPVMVRGMANLQHDQDWMVRHLGSNLQKGTLDAVHRGLSSDTAGSSYVPAAADRANFGRHGMTQGFKVHEIKPIKSVLDN